MVLWTKPAHSSEHNIYLLGGEEVDAESPTGSRTVNRCLRDKVNYARL